jgi:hypothetical protein
MLVRRGSYRIISLIDILATTLEFFALGVDRRRGASEEDGSDRPASRDRSMYTVSSVIRA